MDRAIAFQAQTWTRDLRNLDSEDMEGGTGVAVRIGPRHFLATAAHVIKGSHRIEVVRRSGEDPIGFDFRNAFWTGPELDVGLLELSEGQAGRIGEFVGEKNILTRFDQGFAHNVIVSGFPARTHRRIARDSIGAVGCTERSATLPLTDWPKEMPERPPVSGRDVFVPYPENQNVQVTGPGIDHHAVPAIPMVPPHPRGMSGGGIWLEIFGRRESGIHHPYLQLIGVQVAFVTPSRLLRGTLIQHWLDLVAEHYPDLRSDIARIKNRKDLVIQDPGSARADVT